MRWMAGCWCAAGRLYPEAGIPGLHIVCVCCLGNGRPARSACAKERAYGTAKVDGTGSK